MSKQTVYIPIPVSSGELPEEEDGNFSIDVVGIDSDNYPTICYYVFSEKIWTANITHWLKEKEIDIPDEEPTKKEKVPELTEEEIENKARDFYWKRNPDRIIAENSRPDMVIGYVQGYKAASKVEVKWEENTNTPK